MLLFPIFAELISIKDSARLSSATNFETLPDEEVVEYFSAAPQVFTVLYDRYLVRVYWYLKKRINNTDVVEEITSQVFLDALESLYAGRYKRGSLFAAWLFSIVRHRLVDSFREHPSSNLENDAPAMVSEIWAEVEKRDDQSRLSRLISELDEEKQEILRLRFSADLSFSAIAELIGKSEAAVKMSCYRTLEWIRSRWEESDE